MKKPDSSHLTSFRTLERRQSKDPCSLTTKQPLSKGLSSLARLDFGNEAVMVDDRVEEFVSSQSDIAKRIQTKLRSRKIHGSEKRISKQLSKLPTEQHVSPSEQPLSNDQLHQMILEIWEKNQGIANALCASSTLQPQVLKEKIMGDMSLLTCLVNSGQTVQQVLLKRISRIDCMAQSSAKCQAKEAAVNQMFEERLVKLSELAKTR